MGTFLSLNHLKISIQHLPNYEGNGIVNLVSSLASARGYKTGYRCLKKLPPREIKERKNVVLITIDGLGYKYLKERGQGSYLERNLKEKMTSVFPATTGSAMTSFYTGLAPQQHGIPGWSFLEKDYGMVLEPLPLLTHKGKVRIEGEEFDFEDVFDKKSIFEKIDTKSFLVTERELFGSKYTEAISEGAEKLGYNTMRGFFMQLKKAIESSKKKKYIHGYWPKFDMTFHENGLKNDKVQDHFRKLDEEIKNFMDRIQGTDTTVIITADHGLVEGKEIDFEEDDKFYDCLSLPLTGDSRNAYCHVKPSKKEEFESYVKNEMKEYFELHKSEELVEEGYFGIKSPDEKLYDRVGDYTLLLKERYAVKKDFKGHHGGMSEEEMMVPLIVKHLG